MRGETAFVEHDGAQLCSCGGSVDARLTPAAIKVASSMAGDGAASRTAPGAAQKAVATGVALVRRDAYVAEFVRDMPMIAYPALFSRDAQGAGSPVVYVGKRTT